MKHFPRRAGAPAAEPVTLTEALVQLRKISGDGGADDAYITSLISVAREACEERTERTLVQTSWTLTLDGFPDAIELMRPPVIAVQSVVYVDEAGVSRTLNPADYVVDRAREPGWLVPGPGKAWPATQDGAINTVVVTYTAGYGATADGVPAPLKHWILLTLTDLYETRGSKGEKPLVPHGFEDHLLDPFRLLGI